MKAHILQIAPTPFFADRGCHIRIEGIVRCLTELGFDNTVCTYHHGRDVDGIATKRISTIKNYTQTAAGPSKYKLWADWKLLWLSFKHYRRLRPVALHAHLHEGLMIGAILKTLFFWHRTPLIADMQGSLTGELESHGSFKKLPFLRWPTHLLERILMWFADYIVCSSSHSLSKLKSEFNLPEDKISLAQDGADPAPSFTSEARIKLRQELGIPLDKTLVVYSGALLDAKGLSELKELIASVGDKSPDVHFLVIGYPIENLEQFLLEKNLVQACTLSGQIAFERLSAYLSLADIAVEPKFSDAGEGSGKMLNYLASGLPVIAFNTLNNREFLPSGVALAKDIDELSENLLELHTNKQQRENAAKASLQRFQEYYSWEVTKSQLEFAYTKVLGKN